MNIRKQTSSSKTEPVSRSARETGACPPGLRIMCMSFGKEWDVSKKLIYLGLALLIWNAGNLGYAVQTTETADSSTGEDLQTHHVVTGTLDRLDFDTGKGLLKTDLGKSVFFAMVRPELFRRLSLGQRVTIGMNEQGQAVKVMEIPPSELPIPPSAAQ